MQAGKLDRIITIERQTKTVTPSGGTVTAWTIIATPRAEIVKQSASEFLTGFGEAENGSAVFRIRWRADITTADRIVHDGVAHDIKEIAEIGRRRGLKLRAVATS
ncbi:head-tail adaptor protein [Bosea sp. Leaf344]|uniref:phage head closure protein n=1 Tax=Bosea sp. Leaf344 TaxID=1736346 RepID=UPI0006FBBFCD|nr:phage head closure protein [Bosea sp. Leaf344]KQU54448.1 head-tail adaptor protein [Bosea sp. Leaf344]